MSYSDEQVTTVATIAISEFSDDHEFTGYGIATVTNAILEVLGRNKITSQSMYNWIKTYKSTKSMDGVVFNKTEALELITAYLTGKAKAGTTKLSESIKAKMAEALKPTESIQK